MLKRRNWQYILIMVSGLVACVTVNTYFPDAAAEKAADRIIEEVWGKDGSNPPVNSSQPAEIPRRTLSYRLQGGGKGLDFMVAPAAALEAEFIISSPGIERIRASMERRYPLLETYFQDGILGLTYDGFVAIRATRLISLQEWAWLDKLIAAENADRKALYRELAKVNKRPEWARQIQQTFARRWIQKAPAGWWYQNTQGYWEQKE